MNLNSFLVPTILNCSFYLLIEVVVLFIFSMPRFLLFESFYREFILTQFLLELLPLQRYII